MKINHRNLFSSVCVGLLTLLSATSCYSLPFDIVVKSGTSLPKFIFPGQTVTALYTVSNNSGKVLPANFVKYLPPNVRQVVTDFSYPDLCGQSFQLNAKGSSGDSCTLELKVSGVVSDNSNSPKICTQNGTTCAGTNSANSLQVVAAGTKPQFAYMANQLDNSISICQVTAPEAGFSLVCQKQDNLSIPLLNAPVDVVINQSTNKAYVANTGNYTLIQCDINATSGLLTNCSLSRTFPANSLSYGGLNLSQGGFLYLTDFVGNDVYICPIGTTASCTKASSCTAPSGCPHLAGPSGRIGINQAGTHVYISNYNDNSIADCEVSADGSFKNCSPVTYLPFPVQGSPVGADLNPSSTYLYVALSPNSIAICKIDQTQGSIGDCNYTTGNGGFNFDYFWANLFIGDNNYAYIPNNNVSPNNISICQISAADGSFLNCSNHTDASFNGVTSFWLAYGKL